MFLINCSLEEDQRRGGKHCGDGLLGYGDDEVRVSHGWEERGGEVSSMASEVCVDKSMCKRLTARSPRSATSLIFHT